MYNVILTLDKCFLKYEGRGTVGGGQIDPPQEKASLRKTCLVRVKNTRDEP